MKKFLFALFFAVIGYSSFSQPVMQSSLGTGSTSSRIRIFIKLTAPLVNGNISTFQFNVAIPSTVSPTPTLSIVGTPLLGSGWAIQPTYTEDGYLHYEIISATGGSLTLAANNEMEVMELEFTGGPSYPINISLVTLPFAGSTGNALFQCTGAAESVEGQLYYARAGVTVLNNNSYTGSLSSWATLSGITLPVSWLSFNAAKQDNDGLLNWLVSNENNCDRYELQRSTNGSVFATIATIAKANNGGRYDYTDAGINLTGSKILYYRIKQVDVNGLVSYSEIRSLRMDVKTVDISIRPNPVTEGFYINTTAIKATAGKKVQLNLIGADGKLAAKQEVDAAFVNNYYFDIQNKKVAAGQYTLQVVLDEVIIATKKVFVIH